MGIPTSDGPDLIINRMKQSVSVSWRLVGTIAVVAFWGLFAVVPYLLADVPSPGRLTRWTVVALTAAVVISGLPPLIASERRGAAIGMMVAAAAAIVTAWIATA